MNATLSSVIILSKLGQEILEIPRYLVNHKQGTINLPSEDSLVIPQNVSQLLLECFKINK